MKKRIVMALAAIAIVSLLVVGGTLAWFTDSESTTNVFTAGSVIIEINEVFEDITDWVPGDTEIKEVKFTSTGVSATYLRVQITPTWYDGNNQLALEGDVLQFNFAGNNDWVESGGWYYYIHVLNEDEETSLLLESVEFLGGVDNVNYSLYQGKTLKIVVQAEAVQAEHNAFIDAWEIDELPFILEEPV